MPDETKNNLNFDDLPLFAPRAVSKTDLVKIIYKEVNDLVHEESQYKRVDINRVGKSTTEIFEAVDNYIAYNRQLAEPEKKHSASISKADRENVFKEMLKETWSYIKDHKPTIPFKIRSYLLEMAFCGLKVEDANDLSLRLPQHRKLVVDNFAVKKIGIANAEKIINHVRLKKIKNNEDAAVFLIIELLWQGIPLKYILGMNSLCFDPENNIIYLPDNNSYDIASGDTLFWLRFFGILRELKEWFMSYRAKEPFTMDKYVYAKRAYPLINKKLVDYAIEAGITNTYKFKTNNFMHAGRAHKIYFRDVAPSYYTAISGIKVNTSVLSLETIYPKLKLENSFENDFSSRSVMKKVEVRESVAKYVHKNLTTAWIDLCKSTLNTFENSADLKPLIDIIYGIRNEYIAEQIVNFGFVAKSPLLKELIKVVGNESFKNIISDESSDKRYDAVLKALEDKQFMEASEEWVYKNEIDFLDMIKWIVDSIKGRLSIKSILKYFYNLKKIWSYCDVTQITFDMLDKEDMQNILLEYNTVTENNKKLFVSVKTFVGTVNAYNSFYRSIIPKKQKYFENVDFSDLNHLKHNVPKYVFIPSTNAVNNAITRSWDSKKDPVIPMMCILGCYMGLRREEMVRLETMDVRISDSGLEYVIFVGKGGKIRHVYLKYVPEEFKKYFYSYFETALSKNYKRFLNVKTVDVLYGKIKSLHDVFPEGLHTMRRYFATYMRAQKHSVMEVSNIMGHEQTSTLKSYSQHRFRDIKREEELALHGLSSDESTAYISKLLNYEITRPVNKTINSLTDASIVKTSDKPLAKKKNRVDRATIVNAVMKKLFVKFGNERLIEKRVREFRVKIIKHK